MCPVYTVVMHRSSLSPASFLVDVSGMSVHLKWNKKPIHGQMNQVFDVLC